MQQAVRLFLEKNSPYSSGHRLYGDRRGVGDLYADRGKAAQWRAASFCHCVFPCLSGAVYFIAGDFLQGGWGPSHLFLSFANNARPLWRVGHGMRVYRPQPSIAGRSDHPVVYRADFCNPALYPVFSGNRSVFAAGQRFYSALPEPLW